MSSLFPSPTILSHFSIHLFSNCSEMTTNEPHSLTTIDEKLSKILTLAKNNENSIEIKNEVELIQNLLRNESARTATEILRQSKVLTLDCYGDDEYILKEETVGDAEGRPTKNLISSNEIDRIIAKNQSFQRQLVLMNNNNSSKSVSESTKQKLYNISHHPQNETNLPIKEARKNELSQGILSLIERKLIPASANLIIKPPPFEQNQVVLQNRVENQLVPIENSTSHDEPSEPPKKFIRPKISDQIHDKLDVAVYKLDTRKPEEFIPEKYRDAVDDKIQTVKFDQKHQMIKNLGGYRKTIGQDNSKKLEEVSGGAKHQNTNTNANNNSEIINKNTLSQENLLKSTMISLKSSLHKVPQNSRQPSAKLVNRHHKNNAISNSIISAQCEANKITIPQTELDPEGAFQLQSLQGQEIIGSSEMRGSLILVTFKDVRSFKEMPFSLFHSVWKSRKKNC